MRDKGKYQGTFNGQGRPANRLENVDPYWQEEQAEYTPDATICDVVPSPVERRGLFGLFLGKRGPVQVGHKGAQVEIPQESEKVVRR